MKYFSRPRALRCLMVAVMFAVTATVCAQDYPNRDITFIVPFSPGGGADLLSRQFADQLAKTLHGTVNIENKPGGGSAIGIGIVVRAKPDGYTIGFAQAVSLVYLPMINKDLAYKTPEDYQPITRMSVQPHVLFVLPNAPWKTFHDFMDTVRKNPGKIRVSNAGVGQDLPIHELNKFAKVELVSVPFTGGSGEAIIALLGGRVEALITGAAATGQYQAGKIRALAVFQKGPEKLFPDAIPTFEAGYGAAVPNEQYLIAPKGLPKNVLDKLTDASLKVLRSEEFVKFANSKGFVVKAEGPKAAKENLVQHTKTYSAVKDLIEKK